MESIGRQRCIYASAKQKKKLIELMAQHPELISCKVTQDFNYKDSQNLWQNITNDLNSLPGARKTWRQWRKTWHDLRWKTKKKQTIGEQARTDIVLTAAEQEALGIKNLSSASYHGTSEFVSKEQDIPQENINDDVSLASLSESDSVEKKVIMSSRELKPSKHKNNLKNSSKHSSSCYLNCDIIASQEQRKLEIKEDYLSFKKEYLKQKLQLIKEQTESLKCIAKELSEFRNM